MYRHLYGVLHSRIQQGYSFEKIFSAYSFGRIIPSSVRQLILSAEKSGTLSSTLLTIGERYEERTQTTAKNLSTLLEPLLLFVVWLGVVVVALSVVMPIYGLVGGINQNNGGEVQEKSSSSAPIDISDTLFQEAQEYDIAYPIAVIVSDESVESIPVYSEDSLAGDVVGSVVPGARVSVVGGEEGEWLFIEFSEGERGWIGQEWVSSVEQ